MIRIGVIGVGHLGKVHLKLLKEIPQFELVGFYDHDKQHSELAEKDFGVKSYPSFDELVNDVDAIDIVTPASSHYEYATKSIRKSKHIFIEKPITLSSDEAKKLVSLSHEGNIKGQVGHVERFNPAFVASKPYIKHPLFIECQRLAQFNPRGMDVSVVLDVMIHDIDLVLSMINSPVKRISATGIAVIGKTPDIANARIEFDNGSVANITSSRIAANNKREMQIFQSDSYITIDFLNKKSEVISLINHEKPLDGNEFNTELLNRISKDILKFETPSIIESNAIKTELECFADAILTNGSTPVTIEDGYYALNIANKINDKIKLTSHIK
jgi:predicted dehydrogenase